MVDESTELERRRRELEALQAIALAANRDSSVAEFLDAAIEIVHRTFQATTTTWSRSDPDRAVLTLEAHRGLDDAAFREELGHFPVGKGITGTAAATRKPQLSTNYGEDPRKDKGLHVPGFRGVMCAPVSASGELLGVIAVGSMTLVYDESELRVLTSVGAQLGTALENARLLARLRASEGRYRTFVEAMPYAVYEARPSGDLLYASPKIEELTGHAPARFESEPGLFSSLVHPDDRAARAEKLARLARPGERVQLEYRLVHRNGVDIVWVSDQALAREAPGAPGGILLLGVLVDLRERKLIEAAAREHARLASLGELAAGVAHEVNNPLSGVLNYAQLAQRILGLHPENALERLAEPIEGIVAEAERILEITRTLVSFARRPEKEAFRPLPAHELVRASLTIMKQRLKENSIAVEVDVPEDLPPLRARGHELTQVLQNLITNARAALDQRFPRWDPAKRLSFKGSFLPPDAASPTGYVRIEVADRGIGISRENLSKIFVPFFTTKRQGTGLGLAIAKEIVLAHAGKIDVRSSPDEGTVFSFTIPAF
jgi:PAS domain S-box-containing protein